METIKKAAEFIFGLLIAITLLGGIGFLFALSVISNS